MLKDLSELAKNTINKNLIVFKVFLKKTHKFLPRYWIFSLKTMFSLIPLLNYCFKKNKAAIKI